MIPKDVYVGDKRPDLRVRMADLPKPGVYRNWAQFFDAALDIVCRGVVIFAALYVVLWVLPQFVEALWRAAK